MKIIKVGIALLSMVFINAMHADNCATLQRAINTYNADIVSLKGQASRTRNPALKARHEASIALLRNQLRQLERQRERNRCVNQYDQNGDFPGHDDFDEG